MPSSPASITAFISLKDALTLLIAFIVAYIAYQQWLVNKNKIRLDLFEKRYVVYKKLKAFVDVIVKDNDIPWDTIVNKYGEIFESRFLFEDEVYQFINRIAKNYLNLERLRTEINHNLNLSIEKRDEFINEHNQILNSIFVDSQKIEDVFMVYLQFKNIKTKNRWKFFFNKIKIFFKPVYIFLYKLIHFRKLRKQKKEYNNFMSGAKRNNKKGV